MSTTDPFYVPSTDGVTIAVHELCRPPGGGDDGREVLLVCHATGFCGWAYEPLAHELAGKFRVVALDFRGHGDSSAPANGNFDWRALAGDLLCVVDALGVGSVVGFGHSLGGAALVLAEHTRPGTLSSAYLYEPIVFSPGDGSGSSPLGADPFSEGARRRRASFPSKAEALARYASRPPLNTLQAGALAAYVEHGMAEAPDGSAVLKCTPANEAATFEAAGKPGLDLLGSIETPITVAVGTTERGWTPAVIGPAVAEALPRGTLERHPLLGHFGPLQGPITVGAMVLAATGG